MQLGKVFGTDKVQETEGKWFDIGDNARIRVARFGNAAHQRILTALRGPYKPLVLRGGEIPHDANADIIKASVAKAVLMGWEGLVDENLDPIPFSPENALDAFNDYNDFYELVSQLSLDAANFRVQMQEDIAKKSPGSSTTHTPELVKTKSG